MTDKEYIEQVNDILRSLENTKKNINHKSFVRQQYNVLQEIRKHYEFASKGVFENVEIALKSYKPYKDFERISLFKPEENIPYIVI